MEGNVIVSEGKQIPAGVKVISVFYYISAVLGILSGILFLVATKLMGPIISQVPVIGTLGSMLFIVGGVVMLFFGILNFFVGRGLWKGKNWARIFVIIFAVLGIIVAVYLVIKGSFVQGISDLLVSGLIAGYLLFSSKVKEAFA